MGEMDRLNINDRTRTQNGNTFLTIDFYTEFKNHILIFKIGRAPLGGDWKKKIKLEKMHIARDTKSLDAAA